MFTCGGCKQVPLHPSGGLASLSNPGRMALKKAFLIRLPIICIVLAYIDKNDFFSILDGGDTVSGVFPQL